MSRFIFTFSTLMIASSLGDVRAEVRIPPEKTLKATLDEVAPLAQEKKWEELAAKVSPEETNELYRLLKHYALLQIQNYEELLRQKPINGKLYRDYDLYIRALAAHESKNYKILTTIEVGSGAPKNLRRDTDLLRAKAFVSLNQLSDARKAFQEFLKRYRKGYANTEAQLELARIESELGNQETALQLYETLYTRHPVRDRQNVARRKLKELGGFSSIQTSQHLLRVNQLKRAALFDRAVSELDEVEKGSGDKEKTQIEFIRASLEFARKAYSTAEKMSRDRLKELQEGDELYNDWLGLLAFSITRQGKFEEATELYEKLLERDLSPYDGQQILLRLGLMDIDDQIYERAAERFRRLREDFPRGRFRESSHWFEAWSRLQAQRTAAKKNEPLDLDELETASDLLSKIPSLPEGFWMIPQSLYWRLRLREIAKTESLPELKNELLSTWRASYYSIYFSDVGFKFLNYEPIYLDIERVDLTRDGFKIPGQAFRKDSWNRLEAFAKVRLYDWAKLEMHRFLSETKLNSDGLRRAIAYRLKELGDWSDLVRFATNHHPSPVKNLTVGDEVAYFHYPQAYYQEVIEGARENKISPFLIWGVMREESRFQADVISGAGAVGLMQLMPSLGARIARTKRESQVGRTELQNPQLNIRYGSFHLSELLNQVKRMGVPREWHFPLVVASYNAGLQPVKRWLKEFPTDNLDEWVENIPYSETRGYVKRVIRSAHVYYQLYGEPVATMAKTKEEKDL